MKQIRSPKIDPGKLDRKHVRDLLDRPDSFDWDKGSDASEWSGVSLDSDDRILGLNISHRNLSGDLPVTLGEISNLEYFHATSNYFTGELTKIASNPFLAVLVQSRDLSIFWVGRVKSLIRFWLRIDQNDACDTSSFRSEDGGH